MTDISPLFDLSPKKLNQLIKKKERKFSFLLNFIFGTPWSRHSNLRAYSLEWQTYKNNKEAKLTFVGLNNKRT